MFLSVVSTGIINIKKSCILADEHLRHMVFHTAILWGWNDPAHTVAQRKNIAIAACKLVAYDNGYPRMFAFSQLPRWYGLLDNAISSGEIHIPCYQRKKELKATLHQ